MNTPRIYPPVQHTSISTTDSNSSAADHHNIDAGGYSSAMEVVQAVPSSDYDDSGAGAVGTVEYVSESAIALREIKELEVEHYIAAYLFGPSLHTRVYTIYVITR